MRVHLLVDFLGFESLCVEAETCLSCLQFPHPGYNSRCDALLDIDQEKKVFEQELLQM